MGDEDAGSTLEVIVDKYTYDVVFKASNCYRRKHLIGPYYL